MMRKAAAYLVKGWPRARICEKLEVDRGTLRAWEAQPEFEDMVHEETEASLDVIRRSAKNVAVEAVKLLNDAYAGEAFPSSALIASATKIYCQWLEREGETDKGHAVESVEEAASLLADKVGPDFMVAVLRQMTPEDRAKVLAAMTVQGGQG